MKFNKRLVIMITDLHGSKFINVDMIFKQISIYILVFLLTLGLFAYASITIIYQEINQTKDLNAYLIHQFTDMQKHNEELNKAIQEKNEEIALVGDRFQNIENTISMQQDINEDMLLENQDSSLLDRIDTVSITALQKSFIMKFIPNGNPLDIDLHISGHYGKRYHPILHSTDEYTGICNSRWCCRLGE